jgi:transcription-repair coupling factor (superfamily II helicase)
VATTIIENGFDIPRANTLIVNRADHFGLSQLYQLRGRVGRSDRRAYAFLLIPSEAGLSQDARKRLTAIREFSDLGAGFRIAAMDLEIRGAGNLLGGEQHGHIDSVGLDLYLKLLDRAIRELKGDGDVVDVSTSINLHLPIQIPEHYISDSNQRLSVYKRITSVQDEDRLQGLREELSDRYGRYPRAVTNLFDYAAFRLQCRPLHVVSLDRKDGTCFIQFAEDTPLGAEDLVQLVRQDNRLSIHPDGTLAVRLTEGPSAEFVTKLRGFLKGLEATVSQ